MSSWTLLENEHIIQQFANNTLSITNLRILYKKGDSVSSMPISNIAMVQATYMSSSLYLTICALGFLVFIAGRMNELTQIAYMGLISSIAFLVLFFWSRRNLIKIWSTGGGFIQLDVKGITPEGLINTIDRLRRAS